MVKAGEAIMVLIFRSSLPQEFVIAGRDDDGRTRLATATRERGDFNWKMKLEHPSGRNWEATYHGENILDALGEFARVERGRVQAGQGARRPSANNAGLRSTTAASTPTPSRRSP